MLSSIAYHLTPASIGAKQKIDESITQINVELACSKTGYCERSGLFKGISWSVIGRKEVDGPSFIRVICSDVDIMRSYA